MARSILRARKEDRVLVRTGNGFLDDALRDIDEAEAVALEMEGWTREEDHERIYEGPPETRPSFLRKPR